jgi:predicted DNA-binding transcriptional regulator AlpA
MSQIYLNGITLQELVDALYPLFQLKQVERQKQQDQSSNDLMTRKEVCELLSINFSTLWKHTKSGKLKSSGIGNRVFYSRAQVLEAVKPINS